VRPPVDVVVPTNDPALAALVARLERLELREGDTVVVAHNRRRRSRARERSRAARASGAAPSSGPSSASGAAPASGAASPSGSRLRVIDARAHPGSYFARNIGAAAGSNPWIVFLDADVEAPADLLDRLFDPAPEDGTGVLRGGVRDEPGGASLAARYAEAVALMDQSRAAGYAQTANCAVRRAAFARVGGFRADVRSGGDADLCFRLAAAGWALEDRPDAAVVHRSRTTLPALLRQRVRVGAGAAWLARSGAAGAGGSAGASGAAAVRAAAGSLVRAARTRDPIERVDRLGHAAAALGALLPNVPRGAAPPNRPTVALLADAFPELTETFVVNEVRALRRLGHEVVVLAANAPHEPAPGVDEPVTPLGRRDLGAAAWLAARHPLRATRDVRTRDRWRPQEQPRPLRDLAHAARRLHATRAEHLHAHFAAGAALDAVRLGALLGLPVSITAHAHDVFATPRNLEQKLDAAAFVTTGCEYNARHLRRVTATPVHVIVMGVDARAFTRRTPHPTRGHVLAVGRLVPKKGFEHLVEAARRAALGRVLIAGDGPLRTHLNDPRVELLGARTPAEIRDLLEGAAVLAVPSVVAPDGDRDSMPVVAKEALAMEVPVVATDEVGLPELVTPARGRLVPPGQPDALAAALAEVLALPVEERAAMGRAGRAHVLEACDVDRETERLSTLIRPSVA